MMSLVAILAIFALAGPVSAEEAFNSYIQKAIAGFGPRYGRGFDDDISAYFSQDLNYPGGPKGGVIKYRPDKPTRERVERRPDFPYGYLERRPRTNKTMCVASVTEVIIEALNTYYNDDKSSDPKPKRAEYAQKVPPRKWGRYPYQLYPKRLDIQPYLFTVSWCTCTRTREIARIKRETGREERCEGKDLIKVASGAADALEKFGMGKVLARTRAEAIGKLQPGDLINFDRPHPDGGPGGHGVVFQGWILDQSTKKEIGFKYFSAQGSTKGFEFMHAYFRDRLRAAECPEGASRTKNNDCGVLNTDFVAGRMFHPREWGRAGVIEKKMEELKTWLKQNDLYCGELDDGVPALLKDAAATDEEVFPDYPNLLIDGITEDGKKWR